MPRSRAAQAEDKKRRYHEYLALCAEAGVETDSRRWWSHRKELLEQNGHHRRLTRDELRAWWTAQFTADEIFAMAGALDAL